MQRWDPETHFQPPKRPGPDNELGFWRGWLYAIPGSLIFWGLMALCYAVGTGWRP